MLKLPGFINYNRALYEGESSLKDELIETEFVEYGDLLRARTTIRNNVDGSNSRLNRWSDGSWTLQIGSEHFEVLPQVFSAEENNLIFLRHQSKEFLEAVGKLANKLTVRPYMDSQGTHRKYLALAEATGKGMKKVKVRAATTTIDPEKEKRSLVKIQQERIKARRKLDAKRRNLEQKTFDRVGREGLTARFLEEDEDEYDDQADEYDADFIDDGEIEEVDIDDEVDGEEDENSQVEDAGKPVVEPPSRTSRLIFDDDDDD
jgi:RNA polymerase-associated protein LEO1